MNGMIPEVGSLDIPDPIPYSGLTNRLRAGGHKKAKAMTAVQYDDWILVTFTPDLRNLLALHRIACCSLILRAKSS